MQFYNHLLGTVGVDDFLVGLVKATVTELYGDFRSGRRSAAVMAIQFTLVDLTGISPQVQMEQTIASSIPLTESSLEALVDGYGRALGEILEQLAAMLRTAG